MKLLSHIAIALILLAFADASAQKAETEKAIAGCWKIVDFSMNPAPPNIAEIKKAIVDGTVCFENGRFTSKRPDGAKTGSGTFAISADGKSISQKTDGMPEGMDEPDGIIQALTESELVMHSEETTIRLVRVKP